MNIGFAPNFAGLHGTAFTRPAILSPDDEAALCAAAGATRSFKSGVDLVAEGARTNEVFLLTRGWACRYKLTRDGARQITGLVMPGDLCNLDTFMLERVAFGVRSLSAVTVVGWPRDRLQALAAERPAVARVFTWLAIVENAVLSQWALALGRLSARERLAHLLCELMTRLGGSEDGPTGFDLPITQEHIADALGLTAVHVNRTLQQLRSEGLVVVEGRRITVPDMAALCRLAGFNGTYLHPAPVPPAR